MSKRRDLVQILLIVIIGMFIPFLISIVISFSLDITNLDHLSKVGTTFLWFLLIFGIELFSVFLYFNITYRIANKKLDDFRHRE
jgi:hypothetical protein